LTGTPELLQLALGVEHAGEDPLGDRAEVVVVELVALRRLAPNSVRPVLIRSGRS
jgi:hypothetical protein